MLPKYNEHKNTKTTKSTPATPIYTMREDKKIKQKLNEK